jgi:hypothetical protein
MHLDIPCKDNQPDALFIINLLRQSASSCFGLAYYPPSGGIHCICTAAGMCYMFKLIGCWLGQDGTQMDNKYARNI